MRRLPPLIGAVSSLVCAGLAGEIRLPKIDTVEVAGSQYQFLGLESDSAFVLITGSGRTWLYAFPRIDAAHPAGSFGFTSHEGRSHLVTLTGVNEVRLDLSDTLSAPRDLPPAYFISKLSLAPLVLQLREDLYRFTERGIYVAFDGEKEVTLIRTYNGVAEDTVPHPLGTPVRFHAVTITLHAIYHGGVGGLHVYILGYSPIHAAGSVSRPPPRSGKTSKPGGPLFPHPHRIRVLVGPSGRIADRFFPK